MVPVPAAFAVVEADRIRNLEVEDVVAAAEHRASWTFNCDLESRFLTTMVSKRACAGLTRPAHLVQLQAHIRYCSGRWYYLTNSTDCVMRRPLNSILLLLLIALSCCSTCFARRRKDIKADVPDEIRYHEAGHIIALCFFVALAPLGYLFIRSIVADPATPHLARAMWHDFRRKMIRSD